MNVDHSKAFQVFVKSQDQAIAVMYLTMVAATDPNLDKLEEVAPKLVSENLKKGRREIKYHFESGFDELSRFVYESTFVLLVAAFEAFLSDVLREILTHEPELLVFRKAEITIDETILSKSPSSLRKYIIEKSIQTLLRDKILEILKFLAKLTKKDKDFQFDAATHTNLIKVLEIRNLMVHKRGIVDERSNELIGGKTLKIGSRYELSLQELMKHLSLMSNIAILLNFRTPHSRMAARKKALLRMATGESLS